MHQQDESTWNSRYHYVLWSGGLDSTCLLYEVASKYGTPTRSVFAISMTEHPHIHENKEKAEAHARKKFLRYAEKKHLNIEQFQIRISDCPPVVASRGPDQAWIWLLHSAGYIWDHSVLHMGYVREDCVWHYKHEVIMLFDAVKNLKGYDTQISFPYEWTPKHYLLTYQSDNGIPDNCIWYCESPKRVGRGFKNCGCCGSCESHNLAVHRRKHCANDVGISEPEKKADS